MGSRYPSHRRFATVRLREPPLRIDPSPGVSTRLETGTPWFGESVGVIPGGRWPSGRTEPAGSRSMQPSSHATSRIPWPNDPDRTARSGGQKPDVPPPGRTWSLRSKGLRPRLMMAKIHPEGEDERSPIPVVRDRVRNEVNPSRIDESEPGNSPWVVSRLTVLGELSRY